MNAGVWFHVLHGEVLFVLIPPTLANVVACGDWQKLNEDDRIRSCLCDTAIDISRIELKEGQSLILPAGWMFARHYVKDSILQGSEFMDAVHFDRVASTLDLPSSLSELVLKTQIDRYSRATSFVWVLLSAVVETRSDHTALLSSHLSCMTEAEREGFVLAVKFARKCACCPELSVVSNFLRMPQDSATKREPVLRSDPHDDGGLDGCTIDTSTLNNLIQGLVAQSGFDTMEHFLSAVNEVFGLAEDPPDHSAHQPQLSAAMQPPSPSTSATADAYGTLFGPRGSTPDFDEAAANLELLTPPPHFMDFPISTHKHTHRLVDLENDEDDDYTPSRADRHTFSVGHMTKTSMMHGMNSRSFTEGEAYPDLSFPPELLIQPPPTQCYDSEHSAPGTPAGIQQQRPYSSRSFTMDEPLSLGLSPSSRSFTEGCDYTGNNAQLFNPDDAWMEAFISKGNWFDKD